MQIEMTKSNLFKTGCEESDCIQILINFMLKGFLFAKLFQNKHFDIKLYIPGGMLYIAFLLKNTHQIFYINNILGLI